MPAFDLIDIAIDSALTLLELRDVTLARAEEEDAREIALRIPRSSRLENELIEEAQVGNFVSAETPRRSSETNPSPAERVAACCSSNSARGCSDRYGSPHCARNAPSS
jgi:hypothetical protein